MEPREAAGKETMGSKKKNLTFLRSRLYMLERRKTDTVVDSSVSGDHSGSLRRSQSDRTEYNQKLQEKMTPQAECSSAETPTPEDADNRFCDDDFENISLFVSCRPAGDRVSISDSSSSLSGSCGKFETNGADADNFQEVDEQIFYAVHAFQARSDHELSLQEYQRVHILRFCDLSGNKEWWLAEAQGQDQASKPYQDFAARSQRLILNPLSALLSLFPGPQKLIQKRYDKLLDYNSSLPRSATTESDLAKREYEALNAQLVEELQAFNQAAKTILLNCLCSFVTLLRDLMQVALQAYSTVKTVPLPVLGISEIQSRVLEEVHSLTFVKENSATFIERKLSFEKKKPAQILPEVPHQTDAHRSKLLSTYGAEELYRAKRKCNATQEHDINLLEGELVAVLEQKDPLGSTSRWFVDTGCVKGYVYSSFLKPHNLPGNEIEFQNM